MMKSDDIAVVTVAVTIAVSSCSVSQSREVHFGHTAEGYSSADERTGIRAAPKMFLAPDNVCATAPAAATLRGPQRRIELRAGVPFPINTLVVVAQDRAGAVVPRVPIAIEVEVVNPPLLNHRSDATPENHLHPVRAGSFRIRARTWCDARPVRIDIPAVIR